MEAQSTFGLNETGKNNEASAREHGKIPERPISMLQETQSGPESLTRAQDALNCPNMPYREPQGDSQISQSSQVPLAAPQVGLSGHEYHECSNEVWAELQGQTACPNTIQSERRNTVQGQSECLNTIQGQTEYPNAIQGQTEYSNSIQGQSECPDTIQGQSGSWNTIQGQAEYPDDIQGQSAYPTTVQGQPNTQWNCQGRSSPRKFWQCDQPIKKIRKIDHPPKRI